MKKLQTLRNVHVIVTREEPPAGPLARAVAAYGAKVDVFPLVRHTPPVDEGPLFEAARNIRDFDGVLFTSARGVDAFTMALELVGGRYGATPVSCVGQSTADRARESGALVDRIARNTASEGLVKEFASEGSLRGRRFVYPCAEQARPVLAEGLRKLGAEVVEAPAYRTEAFGDPDALSALIRNADAILFCSPSATWKIGEIEDRAGLLANKAVGSMGPATTEALREVGIRPSFEPKDRTFEGMAEALSGYWMESGKGGQR